MGVPEGSMNRSLWPLSQMDAHKKSGAAGVPLFLLVEDPAALDSTF